MTRVSSRLTRLHSDNINYLPGNETLIRVLVPAMSLSPPQTEEALNVELGKFLRRIYSSRSEILEYEVNKKNLSVWPWCVSNNVLL